MNWKNLIMSIKFSMKSRDLLKTTTLFKPRAHLQKFIVQIHFDLMNCSHSQSPYEQSDGSGFNCNDKFHDLSNHWAIDETSILFDCRASVWFYFISFWRWLYLFFIVQLDIFLAKLRHRECSRPFEHFNFLFRKLNIIISWCFAKFKR